MRAAWRLTLKRTHGGTIDRPETIAHGLRRAAQVAASPRCITTAHPSTAPVRQSAASTTTLPISPPNAFEWRFSSIASAMIAAKIASRTPATRASTAEGLSNKAQKPRP